MATRTRYSIVKCGTTTDAHKLIEKARIGMPGPFPGGSQWGDSRYLVGPRKLSVLRCADAVIMADDAWPLAQEMARLADCPHLELRVQESDHWDFTLYKGEDLVADFSTNVLYFDADEAARRPWKQGDAPSFATTWGIRLEKVFPYLRDWASPEAHGPAAFGDQYEIGDWCQVFDFMRVLNVEAPGDSSPSFEIEFPAWTWTYERQPL